MPNVIPTGDRSRLSSQDRRTVETELAQIRDQLANIDKTLKELVETLKSRVPIHREDA